MRPCLVKAGLIRSEFGFTYTCAWKWHFWTVYLSWRFPSLAHLHGANHRHLSNGASGATAPPLLDLGEQTCAFAPPLPDHDTTLLAGEYTEDTFTTLLHSDHLSGFSYCATLVQVTIDNSVSVGAGKNWNVKRLFFFFKLQSKTVTHDDAEAKEQVD